jgi:branched-subunit amino acid aminotransferase/4-amino-4-deoxychorismate lyase
MTELIAYLNGSYIPAHKAALPLHDAGFVYGATITDLCRTFRHQLYKLPLHLERFFFSCRYAGLQLPFSQQELAGVAERLVQHNVLALAPEVDLVLVMFATPGAVSAYVADVDSGKSSRPTLGMHTIPVPFGRNAPLFERGAHLVVPFTRQVPIACVDPRVKQRSRLHWWLADQQARAFDPDAQALLLDESGRITETAMGNVLIVQQGKLLSPPLERILNGVSLQTVRELAANLAIPFQEESLILCDCLNADEVLLAGTTFCVAGVSRINGSAIPWPGATLQKLLSAWSDHVGVDIARQTLANR